MAKDRIANRTFWWAMAALCLLIAVALFIVTSGVLATWFDPDPEQEVGAFASSLFVAAG